MPSTHWTWAKVMVEEDLSNPWWSSNSQPSASDLAHNFLVTLRGNQTKHKWTDSQSVIRQQACLTVCSFVFWMTDWLTDWLAGWLAGWLADWLTGWLTDWPSVSTEMFKGPASMQLRACYYATSCIQLNPVQESHSWRCGWNFKRSLGLYSKTIWYTII